MENAQKYLGFWDGYKSFESVDLLEEKIQIKVITGTDDFTSFAEAWNNLAKESGATVFQTFEWNRTWWTHFGKEGQLYLITFYQGDDLIGIAPMFWDTVRLFGYDAYTALRFIGSNVSQPDGPPLLGLVSYTDYLDFIIKPGYEDEMFEAFINHLEKIDHSVDETVLDVVPETSTMWTKMFPLLNEEKFDVQVEECMSSQLVKVGDSWEDYLSSLSKNRRYQTRLSLKRATQEDYKVFDVVESQSEKELLADFERLAEMHQQKWNQYGSLGSFYEKKNFDFHRQVLVELYQSGWAKLIKAVPVEDKEQCAAMDLMYQFNDRLFAVHGIADPESDYYKEGPGMVLLAATLEQVANSPVEVFDFLRGADTYKLGYSNAEIRNRTLTIGKSTSERRKFIPLVKKYVDIRKRVYREYLTAQLFFEGKSILRGVHSYIGYLKTRVEGMWSAGE